MPQSINQSLDNVTEVVYNGYMNKKQQTTEQRISIRFPFDVLEAIRKRAKANDRSFNGEIIHMLRTLLSQEK